MHTVHTVYVCNSIRHCLVYRSSIKRKLVFAAPGRSSPVLTGVASTGGKRKRKLEPQFTSTPTPKRKGTPVRGAAVAAASRRPVCGIVDSPVQPKRSPRKVQQELFTSIKGPLLPQGSSLFAVSVG